MKRKKTTAIVLALGILAIGGYALGQAMSGVKMTQVTATATVYPDDGYPIVTPCTGSDGEQYLYIEIVGQGPITSSDPRLAGTFYANAKLLHRASDGSGISSDDFEIRDPATGALKAKGKAYATDPVPPEPIKGFAVATLPGGARFWAQSTVTVPPPGVQAPIVIEYGTADPGVQDRAEIFEGAGRCAAMMFGN